MIYYDLEHPQWVLKQSKTGDLQIWPGDIFNFYQGPRRLGCLYDKYDQSGHGHGSQNPPTCQLTRNWFIHKLGMFIGVHNPWSQKKKRRSLLETVGTSSKSKIPYKRFPLLYPRSQIFTMHMYNLFSHFQRIKREVPCLCPACLVHVQVPLAAHLGGGVLYPSSAAVRAVVHRLEFSRVRLPGDGAGQAGLQIKRWLGGRLDRGVQGSCELEGCCWNTKDLGWISMNDTIFTNWFKENYNIDKHIQPTNGWNGKDGRRHLRLKLDVT